MGDIFTGPASGLWTAPNPFTVAPPGSLAVADDVYFSAPQVLSTRRGFSQMSSGTFGTSTSWARSVGYYLTAPNTGTLLVNYTNTGDPDVPDYLAHKDSPGSAFVDFTGTFTAPKYQDGSIGNRMRFVNAQRSCFFNTDAGLFDYDGGTQPYLAGNAQGLLMRAQALFLTNPWLAANAAVAYRYTICSKDAFGRVIEGAPSGRLIVTNSIYVSAGSMTRTSTTVTVTTTGKASHYLQPGDVVTLELSPGETGSFTAGPITVTGTANAYTFTFTQGSGSTSNTLPARFDVTRSVKPRVYLPGPDGGGTPAVSTNNFVRVYRSEQTDATPLTVPATTPEVPSDEVFLVYESAFLTSTDISNGYIEFTDITPESFISLNAVPLYTNPNTGDGTLGSNFQPPVAVDITYWNNQMWFANTYDKHQLMLTLVGVGSGTGLQNGDTVTIAGNTYTATTLDWIPSPPNFYVETNYDPGTNIAITAQNLVYAINLSGQTDVFAYYVSSETGTPGQILLVARDFARLGGFDAFSTRGAAFNPVLPSIVSPPYDISSTDNAHPARVYYSKSLQPEAVPLLNYVQVDSDNDEIVRVFPLQYQLLFFKTNGIFYITSTQPYQLLKLSDHHLIAPDSVALLDGKVYGLTDQGIVVIGAGSVPQQLSISIDTSLQSLMGPSTLINFGQQTLGIGYRASRQYLLWTPAPTLDVAGNPTVTSTSNQAFVYSLLSNAFTRYTVPAQAATVSPWNTLVIAPPNSNQLLEENKTFTKSDYVDQSFQGVVESVSGTALNIKTNGTITAGDALKYGASTWIISSSESDGAGGFNVVTLGETGLVAPVTVTIWEGITSTVRFNKLTDTDPAALKSWAQCSYLFSNNSIYLTEAAFRSEIVPAGATQDLAAGGWGLAGWGDTPWGAPTQQIYRVAPLPMGVGEAAQLQVGFSCRQAYGHFDLLGISVVESPETEDNYG